MEGVSVVICCYNSANRITPTLYALAKQNVDPGKWELIIVDNLSTDGTANICREYWSREEGRVNLKIVNELQPGLSHARKTGTLNAVYDYVLFCDDDNWLDADYIQKVIDIMGNNSHIGALGGLGKPEFESSPPHWFKKYQRTYALGQQNEHGPLSEGIFYGASVTIRRNVFVDLMKSGFVSLLSDRKGNDLVSGGDNELFLWFSMVGYKLYSDNGLVFKHFIPSNRLTISYLLRRATAKGKTEALLSIYVILMGGAREVLWLKNKFLWWVQLGKLLGLGLYHSFNFSNNLDKKLLRNFLISAVSFRLSNYAFLKQSEDKIKIMIDMAQSPPISKLR